MALGIGKQYFTKHTSNNECNIKLRLINQLINIIIKKLVIDFLTKNSVRLRALGGG